MIIGLTGFAGVGKDSVADALIEKLQFSRLSFADALYNEASKAFGVDIEWMCDRTNKETPHPVMSLLHCKDFDFIETLCKDAECENSSEWMRKPRSPREILQKWGTEYRREQCSSYWVDQAENLINKHENSNIVFTDVRFKEEADLIRGVGGIIVRVDRAGINAVNDHPSEQYAKHGSVDYVIYNNGGLDELSTKSIELTETINSNALNKCLEN